MAMTLASIWTCPRNHHEFVLVNTDTIRAELEAGNAPRPRCSQCGGDQYDLSPGDLQSLREWVVNEMTPPVCSVCQMSIGNDGGWRFSKASVDNNGVIHIDAQPLDATAGPVSGQAGRTPGERSRRRSCAAAHVLLASGHAGSAWAGHSGTRWAQRTGHDAALHASQPGCTR